MQSRARILLALLAGATLTASVAAQSILFTNTGEFADDQYGQTLANAGDVDADGFDDMVIGTPRHNNSAGQVQVRSGRTGAVIHSTFVVVGVGSEAGIAVAGVGDINADGHSEYAYALRNPAASSDEVWVRIKDGATDQTLHTLVGSESWRFGHALAGNGDADGDGNLELLIGEPGFVNSLPSITGRVHRVEFANGSYTTTVWEGPSSECDFGHSVAWIGDANGDGDDEFVIGAPGVATGLGDDVGQVRCYQDNFQQLWQRSGTEVNGRYGWSVAGGRDLSGNGLTDVIVGTPYRSSSKGFIQLLNGISGAILLTRTGDNNFDQLGAAVAMLDDIDNDGVADLAVGAPGDGETPGFSLIDRGVVHIVSGQSFATIGTQLGSGSWANLGGALAALGDVTGDGRRDLVTSETYPDFFQTSLPGRVLLLDPVSNDASCTTYGFGTAGTLGIPTLTCSAPPRLGTTTSLHLSNSNSSFTTGAFFAGTVDTFTPLYGGILFVVPTITEFRQVLVGGTTLTLVVPQDHTFSGQRWVVQGLQLDPGAPAGVSFTAPLELVFGGY